MPAFEPLNRGRGRAHAITRLLGGRRFATALMIDSIGAGVTIPLSVLFFTVHQHMPITRVGLGITIGGAVSLLLQPLGGQLIDSYGPKRLMLSAWVVGALAFAAYPFVHSIIWLALVQAAANVTMGLDWTGGTALLAQRNPPEAMPQVMGMIYGLRNLGFGAGGLLATVALAVGGAGWDIAIYLNVVSFVFAFVLVAPMPAPPKPAPHHQDSDPITLWTVIKDVRFVALGALSGLSAFNQVGLTVVLPLWVVFHTDAPRALVGLLYTLNTVIVVCGQSQFSKRVTTLKASARMLELAAVLMAAACGSYLAAHYVGDGAAIGLLVIGSVLLTATEIACTSAQNVISLALADEHHRGKYLSVFAIGWGIEGMIGPSAGTNLVNAGLLVPWPALAVIVAVGTLASSFVVRRAPQAQAESGAATAALV